MLHFLLFVIACVIIYAFWTPLFRNLTIVAGMIVVVAIVAEVDKALSREAALSAQQREAAAPQPEATLSTDMPFDAALRGLKMPRTINEGR